MTDFRALCFDLVEELEVWIGYGDEADCADAHVVVDRARAALAEQPVGPEVEPTLREEFTMILNEARCNSPSRVIGNIELGRRLAAVVEQFKHPTPIPVAERWPEFSDCDPQERVWTWNPVLDHWKLSRINRSVHTHWLPANALPVPADV